MKSTKEAGLYELQILFWYQVPDDSISPQDAMANIAKIWGMT